MGGFRRELTGQRFGSLVAIFRINAKGPTKWTCLCDCGVRKDIRADALVNGLTKSCKCMVTGIRRRGTGEIIADGDFPYCEIPLTQGQVAKISPVYYSELSAYNWQAWWNKNTRSFYAKRNECRDGVRHTIYMHRQIVGLVGGSRNCHGDHKNHDTLDNRRDNLRDADPDQNTWNSRDKRCGNSTGYRGVVKLPNGKFKSYVRVGGGRRISTPQVNTAKSAHDDYLQLVKKYHGEFAYASA
jgi:hypothetical protein